MRGGRVAAAAVFAALTAVSTTYAQYAVGDTVRDFVLKDIPRGNDVRLKAYQNKVILLNFFATW